MCQNDNNEFSRKEKSITNIKNSDSVENFQRNISVVDKNEIQNVSFQNNSVNQIVSTSTDKLTRFRTDRNNSTALNKKTSPINLSNFHELNKLSSTSSLFVSSTESHRSSIYSYTTQPPSSFTQPSSSSIQSPSSSTQPSSSSIQSLSSFTQPPSSFTQSLSSSIQPSSSSNKSSSLSSKKNSLSHILSVTSSSNSFSLVSSSTPITSYYSQSSEEEVHHTKPQSNTITEVIEDITRPVSSKILNNSITSLPTKYIQPSKNYSSSTTNSEVDSKSNLNNPSKPSSTISSFSDMNLSKTLNKLFLSTNPSPSSPFPSTFLLSTNAKSSTLSTSFSAHSSSFYSTKPSILSLKISSFSSNKLLHRTTLFNISLEKVETIIKEIILPSTEETPSSSTNLVNPNSSNEPKLHNNTSHEDTDSEIKSTILTSITKRFLSNETITLNVTFSTEQVSPETKTVDLTLESSSLEDVKLRSSTNVLSDVVSTSSYAQSSLPKKETQYISRLRYIETKSFEITTPASNNIRLSPSTISSESKHNQSSEDFDISEDSTTSLNTSSFLATFASLYTNESFKNTIVPTTSIPTKNIPTTSIPTTSIPTTSISTTSILTTIIPTTSIPTTSIPTTSIPTISIPTISIPITNIPTKTISTTNFPTTSIPTTSIPTTSIPTISIPTTSIPTTSIPTTSIPTTSIPTTSIPTISIPTTSISKLNIPTIRIPTISIPTASIPTTSIPTTNILTTKVAKKIVSKTSVLTAITSNIVDATEISIPKRSYHNSLTNPSTISSSMEDTSYNVENSQTTTNYQSNLASVSLKPTQTIKQEYTTTIFTSAARSDDEDTFVKPPHVLYEEIVEILFKKEVWKEEYENSSSLCFINKIKDLKRQLMEGLSELYIYRIIIFDLRSGSLMANTSLKFTQNISLENICKMMEINFQNYIACNVKEKRLPQWAVIIIAILCFLIIIFIFLIIFGIIWWRRYSRKHGLYDVELSEEKNGWVYPYRSMGYQKSRL